MPIIIVHGKIEKVKNYDIECNKCGCLANYDQRELVPVNSDTLVGECPECHNLVRYNVTEQKTPTTLGKKIKNFFRKYGAEIEEGSRI